MTAVRLFLVAGYRPRDGNNVDRCPVSGRTTVPVFILVPQVMVRKRLDVDGAGDAAPAGGHVPWSGLAAG